MEDEAAFISNNDWFKMINDLINEHMLMNEYMSEDMLMNTEDLLKTINEKNDVDELIKMKVEHTISIIKEKNKETMKQKSMMNIESMD